MPQGFTNIGSEEGQNVSNLTPIYEVSAFFINKNSIRMEITRSEKSMSRNMFVN